MALSAESVGRRLNIFKMLVQEYKNQSYILAIWLTGDHVYFYKENI